MMTAVPWRRSCLFGRVLLACAVVAVMAVAACTDHELPTGPEAHIDPSLVTGNAARALDANGQFRLVKGGNGPYAEISEERAVALAVAYVHRYGPLRRQRYERDRGASIDVMSLKPCDRAFYAASAYQPVPPSASLPYRKVLGPQWLVSLCSPAGVPEISVGVSAYATDVSPGTPDSPLPDPGSANFVSYGIPIGVEIPASPEVAATLAAKGLRQRVSEVPQLIMRPRPNAPMLAVWKIVLEAPARVRGARSGTVRARQVLFVGPGNAWTPSLLDADPSTSADSVETFVDRARGLNGTGAPFTVRRLPRLVRPFEVVTPEAL